MFLKHNINVNALVKCWLFFMLCFAVARYPFEVAVILGLIAGLAGGLLSQWWQLRNNPTLPDSDTTVPKAIESFTKQLKRLGLQSKEEQKRRRQQPRVGLFGGVRPPRPPRSRR